MQLTALGIYGPYPKAGDHACSSYLVQTENANIVMDFGSGALTRLLNKIDVNDLDAIVLSHSHFDHTSDLLPLNYFLELSPQKRLRLIVPKDGNNWYLKLLIKPQIQVIEVEEGDSIDINGAKLNFYAVSHTVKTFGIKFTADGKTLFYTGDTMWFDKLTEYVKGVDFVLADAAKPIGFKGPHMGYDYATKIYEACRTRVVVTHLSPDFNPQRELAGTPIEVVEEGKTYSI